MLQSRHFSDTRRGQARIAQIRSAMSKERLFVVIVSIAILGLSTWAQEADKRREALEELKALLASAPTPTTTGPLRPFTKYDLEILNSDSCQVKYVNDIF